MIVICEECGKKYQVDPSRIKAASAKAKCTACGNMMTISKPEAKPVEAPPALLATREIPIKGVQPPPHEEEPPARSEEEKPEVKGPEPKSRRKGMGLRFKILILFFLFPILLFVGAAYLYLWQLENLSALITVESSKAVTQLGEQIIAEKARSVASQVRLYLLSRPDLKKEGFDADPEFKKLAVQKVGLTGYTALHGVPDNQGIWRNWAHTNPKIVGLDMSTLRRTFWSATSLDSGGFLAMEKTGRSPVGTTSGRSLMEGFETSSWCVRPCRGRSTTWRPQPISTSSQNR